jgi:hypothetical protein
MKNLIKPTLLSLGMIAILLYTSCGSGTGKSPANDTAQTNTATSPDQYFSVKIHNKLWEAFPSKEFKTYTVSYKTLSHQFSIFAEAADGSRMDLSFHSNTDLKPGSYPSTRNDNGAQSGVFYYPEAKNSDKEMASTTSDNPIQENTVQVTKIDKSDKTAYVIEGTFTPVLYALYETNPERTTKLAEGRFRVIYHPDSMNPEF